MSGASPNCPRKNIETFGDKFPESGSVLETVVIEANVIGTNVIGANVIGTNTASKSTSSSFIQWDNGIVPPTEQRPTFQGDKDLCPCKPLLLRA
jgi:hypothetical protein